MSDLFWLQVREAVDQVTTHRNRQIEVERGANKAVVVATGEACILISLEEVPVDSPILVVP